MSTATGGERVREPPMTWFSLPSLQRTQPRRLCGTRFHALAARSAVEQPLREQGGTRPVERFDGASNIQVVDIGISESDGRACNANTERQRREVGHARAGRLRGRRNGRCPRCPRRSDQRHPLKCHRGPQPHLPDPCCTRGHRLSLAGSQPNRASSSLRPAADPAYWARRILAVGTNCALPLQRRESSWLG
jgi:hypothetical protein